MSQSYQMMHPSYMYTSESVPKIPVRESYAATPQQRFHPQVKIEPHPKVWLNHFWNAVHVLAVTYNPTDENVRNSFACFYQSMAGILPTAEAKKIMNDFIAMPRDVLKVLVESKALSSFFTVHRDIYQALTSRPGDFFTFSLTNSDSLFAWTYLLHAYYNLLTGTPVESFNNIKVMYERSQISKETWGNPLWAMIHFCALYAPDILDKYCCTCYKAFISCLRYVLPCPRCRAHLEENLGSIDIDNYLFTKDSLFEYSVKLHNLVNGQVGKPSITIEEARKIYSPHTQPIMQQNANFSNFSF